MTEREAARTDYVAINGAQLYYEMTGQGDTVVLIHAGIADLRMWDAQVAPLAEHHRVLRYDQRGFGRTMTPDGPCSRVDDLKNLLDALGIEKAALVGCSLGGTVALDFALAFPDRVRALVLVGATPSGFDRTAHRPDEWEALQSAWDEAWEAGNIELACELEVQLWVDGLRRSPEEVDPEVRRLAFAMNLGALEKEKAHPHLEDDGPEVPAVGRLGEVAARTLVLYGGLDLPSVEAAARMMAAEIPAARAEVIPDAAHLPNMEHPALFNRLVLEFLADSKSASSGS